MSYKYTDEIRDYIAKNARGKTTRQLTDELNANFPEAHFTESQIRSYKKNHKLTSGIDTKFKKGQISHNKGVKMSPEMYEKMKPTMFKVGNVPHNKRNIGTISRHADGYLYKKVTNERSLRKRCKPLHVEVWEKNNGSVPPDAIVGFLDGNTENCDISNLFLTSRAVNLEMNRKGLRSNDPQITSIGINAANLSIALRRIKEMQDKRELIKNRQLK